MNTFNWTNISNCLEDAGLLVDFERSIKGIGRYSVYVENAFSHGLVVHSTNAGELIVYNNDYAGLMRKLQREPKYKKLIAILREQIGDPQ